MKEALTFEIEVDELAVFLQDVNEHLDAMEAGILDLERGGDSDALNATFRAAHTLKAIAATVGHSQMAEMTHTLETLFDAMRDGRISSTQVVTDTLLGAVDILRTLRDEVVTREPSPIDAEVYLDQLRGLADKAVGVDESADESASTHGLLTPVQLGRTEVYRA